MALCYSYQQQNMTYNIAPIISANKTSVDASTLLFMACVCTLHKTYRIETLQVSLSCRSIPSNGQSVQIHITQTLFDSDPNESNNRSTSHGDDELILPKFSHDVTG